MGTPHPHTRRSRARGPALAAIVCLGGPALMAAERPAAYTVTVYEIWVSDEAPSGEVPKELKKFRKQLERATKKKSFRLEKKPTSSEVREGKPLELPLPGGYQVKLGLNSTDAGALKQVLVNPKKEESELLLKKSPVITLIEKVRKGDGTLLILVEYAPVKKA
jgi:hypothetical protein